MPLSPASLHGLQLLAKYKERVFEVAELESIKQHLLANKDVPSQFWTSVDALIDLRCSGMLTETEQAQQVKESVTSLIGKSAALSHPIPSAPVQSLKPPAPKRSRVRRSAETRAAANTLSGNIINNNCFAAGSHSPVS